MSNKTTIFLDDHAPAAAETMKLAAEAILPQDIRGLPRVPMPMFDPMKLEKKKQLPIRTFISEYNHIYRVRTIKELREAVGGGKVSKMFLTKRNDTTVHIGYVIGKNWLTEYKVVERAP